MTKDKKLIWINYHAVQVKITQSKSFAEELT